MVKRESQLLLNFLKVRLIINGCDIYDLERNVPVAIPVTGSKSEIVATDGYHYTKQVEIGYKRIHLSYLKIVCAIDNDRLLAGLILVVLFYAIGMTSGILFIRLLSFLPILYFLYLFYIRRKDFIQIKAYFRI